MAVLVLARGSSLSRINELKDKPIEECIIINKFNGELENEDLFNFLKDKPIIHMVGIQHNPSCCLTKENYKRLNIKYCVVDRTKKLVEIGGKFTDFMPDHPGKIELESYNIGLEVKYLPDDYKVIDQCKTTGRGYRSSGIQGLIYASHYLQYKDVYVIGVDSHDTPYFISDPTRGKVWVDHRKERIKEEMKLSLVDWINRTPDTMYHIITDSPFRFEAQNVEFL